MPCRWDPAGVDHVSTSSKDVMLNAHFVRILCRAYVSRQKYTTYKHGEVYLGLTLKTVFRERRVQPKQEVRALCLLQILQGVNHNKLLSCFSSRK